MKKNTTTASKSRKSTKKVASENVALDLTPEALESALNSAEEAITEARSSLAEEVFTKTTEAIKEQSLLELNVLPEIDAHSMRKFFALRRSLKYLADLDNLNKRQSSTFELRTAEYHALLDEHPQLAARDNLLGSLR